MTDKIATMLKEMESEHKHTEIFKAMVFPDTERMKEKRANAVVLCEYSCTNEVCDFSSCYLNVEKNPRLLKYHSKEVCLELIKDIDSHQNDFLPSEVDGYYINRMGHELVHLKRSGCDGKGVTGFIEFNDLRKQSMDFYDHQKVKAINFLIDESRKKTCSIM
jgi:hypothetical protein